MDRPRRSGRTSATPFQHASSSRAQYSSPSPASGMQSLQPPLAQPMKGPGGLYAGAPAAAPAAMPMPAPAYANATIPVGRNNLPIPPQAPLAPGQALFSTFASRARLGVSTLMQPIAVDSGPTEYGRGGYGGIDYGTTERTRGGGMRRRAAAGMRYYGEDGSDFDEDDDENDDDDDGDSPSKANTPMVVEEEELAPGALLSVPPPGNRIVARRAPPVQPLVYHEADMAAQADRRDFLVPIKIDIETDTHRIHDVFAWNLREQLIKPGDFARVYVQDLDLPVEPYAVMIEQSIVEQLQLAEGSGYDLVEIGPARGGPFASRDGKKRSRDARSWDWGIKQLRLHKDKKKRLHDEEAEGEAGRSALEPEATGDDGEAVGDARWDPESRFGAFEDDIRVVLDYDVQVYRHHLRDRLEWDLCSPLTPEAFAKQTCKDLCLTGEALPIISNAIREQLLNHSRSAIDLELVGKGAEHARWQREIESADRDIVENRKRKARGLPALPNKPLKVLGEAAEEDGAASSQEIVNPRRKTRSSLAVSAVAQAAAAAFAASSAEGDETPLDRPVASSAAMDETRSGTMTPASAMAGQTPNALSSAAVGKLLAPPSQVNGTGQRPQPHPQQPSSLSSAQAILRTPGQRRAIAEYMQQQLTEKGARRLRGVWREYHESREFGPLLEFLTDEDLERIDTEATRSRRRGRRELQRSTATRRRR